MNNDDEESAARKSSLKGLLKAFGVRESCERWCGELQTSRIQLQLRQPMLKQAVYELPGVTYR